MSTRLSFKKQPLETGLAAVARPYPDTDIKIGGMVVGRIAPPHFTDTDRSWRVSIMVKDPASGGGWRWARLRQKFTDEPSARVWLGRAMPAIQERYELHHIYE